MKKEVIIAAIDAGFFRTKKAEIREAIAAELQEQFDSPIADILQSEIDRRHAEYKRRQVRQLEKQLADAEKPLSGGSLHNSIRTIPGDSFVIACAQNNTDHAPIWPIMEAFAKRNNAVIVLGKTLYNKSAYQPTDSAADGIYFDPALSQFIVEDNVYLGSESLAFIGQSNIIPTAKNPLQGSNHFFPNADVIIPHTSIALQVLPAMRENGQLRGKRVYATGSATLRNMLSRRAGLQAHHNTGFLYCEIDNNGKANCRHIELMPNANGVYDVTGFYGVNGEYVENVNPSVISLGDIHAEYIDDETKVELAYFLDQYKPDTLLLHDLLDFSSRNHHNRESPTHLFRKDLNQHSIVQDINCAIGFCNWLSDQGFNDLVSIESNHDLALMRYLNEWHKKAQIDTVNVEFYHAAMFAMFKTLRNGNSFNALQWAMNEGYGVEVADVYANELMPLSEDLCLSFISADCAYSKDGVSVIHGHAGASGSRGSPKGYANSAGRPMTTGHTHSPSIIQPGIYTAGVTSVSLDFGYNTADGAPCNWAFAHVVQWPNCGNEVAQRQVIFQD